MAMGNHSNPYPSRLKKMMQAFKILRDCGNYDTTISGAIGEVYAEEMLGMDKGKRGRDSVDGWINGRSVQIKTKEIKDDWCKKPLSARFVQLRDGKQHNVDDLVVVMVHPERVWTHYFGPIGFLQARPSNGVVRYHLHQMDGQGLNEYQAHIIKLFPEHLKLHSAVPRKKPNKSLKQQSHKTIELRRLTIRKHWVGKEVILDIHDQRSGVHYKLPHDDLIDIITKVSPKTLKSRSWVDGEVYSWPTISKAIHAELCDRGYEMPTGIT